MWIDLESVTIDELSQKKDRPLAHTVRENALMRMTARQDKIKMKRQTRGHEAGRDGGGGSGLRGALTYTLPLCKQLASGNTAV